MKEDTTTKGEICSKQLQSDCPTPNEPKSSESLRMKHIKELQEDIKDLIDQLKYNEKRRDQAASSRNDKICDQLTEEVAAVKKRKRECEEELRQWNRKQQANWYKKKSAKASDKLLSYSSDECTW